MIFNVGDSVRMTEEIDEFFTYEVGTIVCFEDDDDCDNVPPRAGVKFPTKHGRLHDLCKYVDGEYREYCEDGHGWWISEKYLTLVCTPIDLEEMI